MLELWTSLVFSLFLLIAAVGLMGWHLKTWKTASRTKRDAKQLDYHWRQFRRRMQCSAMLVLLAVAVFVGQWITAPLLAVLFWGGTLLIVAWLALLAVADIIVTVHHFQGLRADCLIEQAKLKAEAKRIKAAGGNGKMDSGR